MKNQYIKVSGLQTAPARPRDPGDPGLWRRWHLDILVRPEVRTIVGWTPRMTGRVEPRFGVARASTSASRWTLSFRRANRCPRPTSQWRLKPHSLPKCGAWGCCPLFLRPECVGWMCFASLNEENGWSMTMFVDEFLDTRR